MSSVKAGTGVLIIGRVGLGENSLEAEFEVATIADDCSVEAKG